MKQYIRWILPVCLVIAGIAPASAQEQEQQFPLSLSDVIDMVLEQNFDIRIAQYGPDIAEENIRQAEADFAAAFTADSSFAVTESQNDEAANTTIALNSGIEQLFKTGGRYQIGLQTETSDLDENGSSSGLSLTLIQPLLKNRGTEVTTTEIVIAQKNHAISVSELRAQVINVLTEVQNTYWNLLLARGVLEADRYSLQLARDQVTRNQAQVNVGTLAPIEVLQAQATAASREVQIITDEYDVRNAEDELKRVLNIPGGDPLWQSEILPTTSPTMDAPSVSLEESIQRALENREELRQFKTSLDIQEISLGVAENQLLPTLDAQASFGPTGAGDDWGGSWGNMADFDSYSLEVGLTFSYPFGNKAAKSSYNQTKLALDQLRLSHQNQERQIVMDVREAVRAVETSYKQIESTGIAEQLAAEQLEAEQQKFEEGLSTNFAVLEYQDNLATAKSDSTTAIVSYQQALAALDQAVGMTLQRYGIRVQ